MRLEYLKEFITLAETGNYSVCADALYISQSSLTRHIQDLEKELHVPLFERTPKGVVLTSTGNLFIPYAKKMLDIQAEYIEAIQTYIKRINGQLNIGCLYAAPEYRIDEILNEWQEAHPSVNMKITEGDSSDLIHKLCQGEIDFAFIREDMPDADSDFARITVNTDHLICAVPENDPIASGKNITIAALKNHRILYYEQCTLLHNLFLGAGYDPSAGLSGSKGRNALLQVKKGKGILLEFRKAITAGEMGGFKILDIAPQIKSNINLIYNHADLSDTAKQFVRFVKQYLEA